MQPVQPVRQNHEGNDMATIVPTVPGIGAALGTGLSKSLNSLVEAKIKQIVEAPQQQRLAQLFSYLSGAPAGEFSPQQVDQGLAQDQPQFEQLPGQQPQQRNGQSQSGIQKNPLIEALQRGNVSKEELLQLSGLAPQTDGQPLAKPSLARQPESQNRQQPRQLDRETFRQLLATLPPHLQAQAVAAYQGQQAKIAEREKENRKTEQLDQREINKRTQPFYDKIIEGEKVAKETKHTLKKLKELEKGDLPPSGLYNVLKSLESIGTVQGAAVGGSIGGAIGGILGAGTGTALGGPVGAGIGLTTGLAKGSATGAAIGGGIGAAIKPITSVLRSILTNVYPDTEEFEKTSLEFVKQARPLIGGHVTENQLDLLMKRIPTLETTKHGRENIINNIGILAEGATADYDALEQIIKENGGKRPDDLEFQVNRRADRIRANAAKRWQD